MTTLNAKANNAYHELIAEYERNGEGLVWPGFDHQRDAYETGWEDGYEVGSKPPHVHQWDEAQATIAAIRELHAPDTRIPTRCRDCLSRLPCPTLVALGDLA